MANLNALTSDNHLVDNFARGSPFDGACGGRVEDDAEDVAYVVQPSVELKPFLVKGVRRATSLVMLLQDDDAVAAFREKCSCDQA